MTKFCQFIATQFYNHHMIEVDDINPLRFAFELLITQMITYLTMIFIGIMTHHFYETIVYCILFGILRKRIQGYHAKTFRMCFVLTILNYIIILLLAQYNFPYGLLNLFVFIFVLIYFKDREKITICYLSILYILLLAVLYYNDWSYLMNMCTLIYITVIVMRVIGGNDDENSDS